MTPTSRSRNERAPKLSDRELAARTIGRGTSKMRIPGTVGGIRRLSELELEYLRELHNAGP